jgi:hypothetical protein
MPARTGPSFMTSSFLDLSGIGEQDETLKERFAISVSLFA